MTEEKEKQNVYKKLREVRKARGLTVDTLAEKLGENSQKVGRIERGKRSLTIDYLMKVSRALDTPVDTLIGEGEAQEATEPTSDALNEVVLFVEKQYNKFFDPADVQKKARLISTIYEMTAKFPRHSQSTFLDSLEQLFPLLSPQRKSE